MSTLNNLILEYQQSIKGKDTEEKLDLLLYRPAGFIIAKLAHLLHMTPTQLSIMGVISGVWGASYFLPGHSTGQILWGAVLFILSGIFDSSDGQLARISQQSTPMGLILDGICDNIVFASIYLCAAATALPSWGWWIYPLAFLGGFCHSFQCAILDFYHREYLYFGHGKNKTLDYWNPSVEEAKNNFLQAQTKHEKILNRLRFTWVAQQRKMSTRTNEERQYMRHLATHPEANISDNFAADYRGFNYPLLKYWRLLGPNFHTFSIIFFILLGRFDLYLLLIDILALNVVILVMRMIQRKTDQELLARWPQ
ncbi:MAG: CDP-alcohol phosphatidyltransferase family protein [Pseudomonadota bacterium]